MILIMLPSLFDSLQSLPGRWQRIEVGGILFSRSEPVRSMYCLFGGEVHLSRTTADGSEVVMQRCIDGMIIADARMKFRHFACAMKYCVCVLYARDLMPGCFGRTRYYLQKDNGCPSLTKSVWAQRLYTEKLHAGR